MCCGCSRLGYCIGNLIYIFEKLASCCALTAVVTCIMTTLIVMLAFGIGLGYNYCFVDFKAKRVEDIPVIRPTYTTTEMSDPVPVQELTDNKPKTTTVARESEKYEQTTEYFEDITSKKTTIDNFKIIPVRKGVETRRQPVPVRRSNSKHYAVATSSPVVSKRTMIVPLDMGVDFLSLISKIRALNKNVTLEIIAP